MKNISKKYAKTLSKMPISIKMSKKNNIISINKNIIKNNPLINPYNIGKSNKDIFFASSFFSIAPTGFLWAYFDPLLVTTIDLMNKTFSLFTVIMTNIIKEFYLIYKEDIEKILSFHLLKFNYGKFDFENDRVVDIILILKIIKSIIILDFCKKHMDLISIINKKKILKTIDNIFTLRNSLFHMDYKKKDLKTNSDPWLKDSIRHPRFTRKLISYCMIMSNIFTDSQLKLNLKHNMIEINNNTFLIKRRKMLLQEIIINDKSKIDIMKNLAEKTIDYIEKKLLSSGKNNEHYHKDIINYILMRFEDDEILNNIDNQLSNHIIKKKF
jgi:hypothetical protein